jgi:hypothetical protein
MALYLETEDLFVNLSFGLHFTSCYDAVTRGLSGSSKNKAKRRQFP